MAAGAVPGGGPAGIGYLLKLIDRAGLEQFSRRLLLGGALTPGEMARVADAFAAHEVTHGVLHARARESRRTRAAGMADW